MGSPKYDVAGRVALITGAARGIGLATAKALTKRGARIAILDLNLEDAESAARDVGGGAFAVEGTVTDLTQMEAAVERVISEAGRLDIVVANAGITSPTAPMAHFDNEAFERVVEIDLMGVWRTLRPALPHVIEHRGHVVVVSSNYAFMNGVLAAPYAAAKAGVEALGRALRVELAAHDAGATIAYFGFVETDMVKTAFSDPLVRQVRGIMPSFATKRLSPAAAGEAIAEGIAGRKPRVMRPRFWSAWSSLRGVLNPLSDHLATRNEKVLDAVRKASERATSGEDPV